MAAPTALIFLTLLGVSSSGSTDCSYQSLLHHLNLTGSSNVQSIMRPVKNWTTSTLVQLDILLFGILDVCNGGIMEPGISNSGKINPKDEKSQTVTNHLWVSMYWTNELLTWNASDFCGINLLTIPRSMLWIPDIIIQEDASDSGSVIKGPHLTLNSSGWVFSKAQQRLTYTCQLNLVKFPFDTQSCNITFTSMSSDVHTMKLGTLTNDTALTALSELIMITKGEWSLRSMEVVRDRTTNGTKSYLIYMITLERKPMLYVVNFIIPLSYLLVLDLASFFISQSSGEKLSFKVTILLSISVLLLILQDMLPSTEDSLPWIATYCVAIFALVGISVLEAMLVSFLTELGHQCGKKAKGSENAREDIQLEEDFHKEPSGDEERGQVTPEKTYMPLDWPVAHDLLKRILDEVKAARLQAGSKDKDKNERGCCKSLALTVDYVFFFLYLITVVLFLMIVYVSWIKTGF
ncbi:5-hydroxytryptamine receptor 3A-like isoform X2 [Amphiprion ocellaris]|uniref:5-hydroxytryptamine receptor 3A-like isoform X2 n=1 Tax=Amphiprion ocellaris TaxID=80972 RepID=UPI001649B57B|nr:5-hydroxytryptamine receptor 3A-like isoform X2 [Amphiprion ocellaris]